MGQLIKSNNDCFLYLQFMFRYPSAYIDKQIRKVFGDFISSTSILPHIDNPDKFIQLRRKLMGQPTARQSQIEAQLVLYKENNEDENENQSISTTMNTTQHSVKKSRDKIIVHYTHENRFTSMKRDMHAIFREAFKDLGIESVRFIVAHRNSPNTQRELIRKRPPMKLLVLNCKGNTPSIKNLL